jgi:glyoxylase-like metal-dependent hydrolase (beta-lactamase superfamily II)
VAPWGCRDFFESAILAVVAVGTIHTIARDLHVVEGHHPRTLWEDPDIPSIVVFRTGRRLYLLDSGLGPEQRRAISDLGRRYADSCDEIVLLNSHGHCDHLGNNNVIAEIGRGKTVRHYLPRAARAALDVRHFFDGMYRRGIGYFDYLAGLTVPADAIASLLRSLGASRNLTGQDIGPLGTEIEKLGILPALSGLMPSLVVDILMQTYPATFPSVETMIDYEDISSPRDIAIGNTRWTGWTFHDDEGQPEVQVLHSGGHSAGGVVFHLPEHKFMMLADETTSVPIWADSDPARTMETARKALVMVEAGQLEMICAGHRPLLPVAGDQARAALNDVIRYGTEFADAVADALRRHPAGMGIDALYDQLVGEAQPDSTIALLARLQFPVFATFLKLTLLNHCLLLRMPLDHDGNGQPTFRIK